MNDHHLTGDAESMFSAMRTQIAMTPMPAQHRFTLRPRVLGRPGLAVGGVGAAIAAAAALLITGAFTSAPPAFAVTIDSGSVTITLNEFSALDAVNARLIADGLAIRAVPAVAGCTATASLVGTDGTGGAPQTLEAHEASTTIGSFTITLGQVTEAGDTVLIAFSADGRWSMFPHEIQGALPTCVGEQLTPSQQTGPVTP
jgi:hypothetical protein